MRCKEKGTEQRQNDCRSFPKIWQSAVHCADQQHNQYRSQVLQHGRSRRIGVRNRRQIRILAEHQSAKCKDYLLDCVPLYFPDADRLIPLLQQCKQHKRYARHQHSHHSQPAGIDLIIRKQILSAGTGQSPQTAACKREDHAAHFFFHNVLPLFSIHFAACRIIKNSDSLFIVPHSSAVGLVLPVRSFSWKKNVPKHILFSLYVSVYRANQFFHSLHMKTLHIFFDAVDHLQRHHRIVEICGSDRYR